MNFNELAPEIVRYRVPHTMMSYLHCVAGCYIRSTNSLRGNISDFVPDLRVGSSQGTDESDAVPSLMGDNWLVVHSNEQNYEKATFFKF